MRSTIIVCLGIFVLAVGACSSNVECDSSSAAVAYVPRADPTPCDAGTVDGLCSLNAYCVTDAGPLACASRKPIGSACASGIECVQGACDAGSCVHVTVRCEAP